ncbi:hypothetical protein SAMN04487867_12125 [Vreelandella titanicae]|jgi:hypothetical protein|uniref:Uncharacterized protein n=1 Tax=Vreelandella titanicae TaxID=664683 RepID=A0AAP9NST2_9GAMM|nr:hypothetical protein FX987_05084 [Halomonas titanicae]SDJ02944.1 hypothetical protein SAMN04487867_12125 [Halomonas titanicae]
MTATSSRLKPLILMFKFSLSLRCSMRLAIRALQVDQNSYHFVNAQINGQDTISSIKSVIGERYAYSSGISWDLGMRCRNGACSQG